MVSAGRRLRARFAGFLDALTVGLMARALVLILRRLGPVDLVFALFVISLAHDDLLCVSRLLNGHTSRLGRLAAQDFHLQ